MSSRDAEKHDLRARNAGSEWGWSRRKLTGAVILSALWLIASGVYTEGFSDTTESDMRWILMVTAAPPALLMLYNVVQLVLRSHFYARAHNERRNNGNRH